MILCVGTTPAVQRVMVFRRLALDAVNRAVTTLDGAAGKSVNVAKVLKALGEQPVAVGFLGGDRGEYLRAVLQSKHIDLDFITVEARTRQCITVIDEATGAVTELVEESPSVSATDYAQLMDVFRRRVRGCNALVMSGTLAAGGSSDFYLHCTRLAQEAGALSLVDAQGSPLVRALSAGPGLVKPNRTELAATVGRVLGSESEVISAMRELHERGARRVVVTAGKDPALAFDGRELWRILSPRLRSVNPVGSGDAFTAALVGRLVAGDDLGESCRWGAAAGAANALTLMAGEVDAQEVKRLVSEVKVDAV